MVTQLAVVDDHGVERVTNVTPNELAEKLGELVRALLRELALSDDGAGMASKKIGLDEVTVNVTLTASGNLAVVKGSASTAVQLRFVPQRSE
jgi:hypothetical protein